MSELSAMRPAEALIICFVGRSTARLRGVHDGLFTGQIDAVDTTAATYRVTFDRSGLGTHTVPDYEVLVRVFIHRTVDGREEVESSRNFNRLVFQSNEPNETMPISAFAQKQRTMRYMQNLAVPPRGPYPSATTPVLLVR